MNTSFEKLFHGSRMFFGKVVFLYSLFLVFSCSSSEWRLKGITSKMEEMVFYGDEFRVNLINPDSKSIEEIKDQLKNSLALSLEDNRVNRWHEIHNLSLKENTFLLFSLNSKTRVIPEFLDFQFFWEKESPQKVFRYYTNLVTSSVRSYPYSSGYPFYPGGVLYFRGGGVYPLHSYPVDTEIRSKEEHLYYFLLVFPKNKKGDLVRIKTPAGNWIEFKSKN